MTFPPFAIVSVPVPKLPILSPPLGPLIQMEPGPVTVTVPVEPADCPTEPPPLLHRAAVLDGKRARAQAADHEGSGIRPAGARSGHRHRALRAR